MKAVFPDGETYTATVNFNGNDTEKAYTIYVPAAQQGKTYSLSAARAEQISSNRPLDSSWTESLSGTLTGSVTAAKLSIATDGFTVSGHVELPEGITIPAGGICVNIRDTDSGLGVRYIFREGLTSADFSFTDYADDADVYVNATLENGAGMLNSTGLNAERADGNISDLNLTFRRTVTVSGTVRLPEGIRDLGANIEINGYVVTIFPGETEAAYSIPTTQGGRVNYGATLRAETYPCLADSWYYVNTDWQFSTSSGTRPTAERDMTGVDLTLSKARLVTGTLAGDGPALRLLDTTAQYRYVSVGVQTERNDESRSVILKDDLSWTLKVPEAMAENCRVYVSIRSDSYANAVQGTYYYSAASAAVTNAEDAALLTIPETGMSGLTLRVTTGWVLEGALTVPEGGYMRNANSSWTSMSVYARNEETSYSGYARVEAGSGPWSFSIIVPAKEAVYTFNVNSSIGSNWTTNIIFRATGAEQAVTGDTSGIRLPLSLAKSTVSGVVYRPAGYTGYLYTSIYVEMVNGEETGETYTSSTSVTTGSSSAAYRVLIPETETMTQYRVRLQVSSDGTLANRIWLTETGATTRQAEAAIFTLQTESKHDITPIEQPKYLSGKIYIPEGISEAFTISVRGLSNSTFDVDPATCPSDANGRYYAYSLRSNSDYETTYRPRYYVSCEEETELYTNRDVYILPDGSTTVNYGDAQDFNYTPGVEETLDFTLVKAICLSGTFADENGTAVRWTQGDGSYLNLSLRSAEGYGNSYTLQVAEDGSWSCKLPPDQAGSYYLSVYPDNGYLEKVLSGNYYYSSEDKVATSQEQATLLAIGAEGVSGVTIRMNTGWLLTGRLTVPEGAYNRLKEGYAGSYTYRMSVYAQSSSRSYYGYATLDVSTGPWTYTITMPKEAGTYTLRTSGSTYSAMDTNILFDQTVSVEGLEVNGDTTVPDMELIIAKAIVKGTVTRPEDFPNYINVMVNVVTASDTLYTAYGYLYNNTDSTEYTLAIPSSDPAETYRVRCNTSVNGLVRESWLTADGTLSKNEADAKVFTIGVDSDTHDFTMLKQPPYLTGKIYIPDDAEGDISIFLRGYGYNSQSVFIRTADCKRDAKGRYVPYTLVADSDEFDFTLYYQVNSDPSGLLLKPNGYAYFYVTEDGGFTTNSSKARSFHYSGEVIDLDLTLLQWNDWNDRYVFQSGHGLEAGKYTYTYTIPQGVTSVSFHFDYADVTLTINGSYYGGLGNRTITFNRSTSAQVVMVMEPTGSGKYYGFGVDQITTVGTPTATSAPLVFTESGSAYARILGDVREGKPLNAVFLGNTAEETAGKALAAAYDANGRFLAAEIVDVTVSSAGDTAVFGFKANENISEIKIMLLDSTDYAPEMQQITIKTAG